MAAVADRGTLGGVAQVVAALVPAVGRDRPGIDGRGRRLDDHGGGGTGGAEVQAAEAVGAARATTAGSGQPWMARRCAPRGRSTGRRR